MLEIRRMTGDDLDTVTELESEIFPLPWSRSGFEDAINRTDTLYLTAMIDEKIVGYCGYIKIIDEAYITNVAVESNFRNQGVAGQMLNNLIKEGFQQGITAFTLEVRESNKSAIHLYEKFGFVSAGIRPNFYEKPTENAVIMWRY